MQHINVQTFWEVGISFKYIPLGITALKTIITVWFLLYHLCLQASVEIIHVDSACKQARSGTFFIALGPPKHRPNSLDNKIPDIFTFS